MTPAQREIVEKMRGGWWLAYRSQGDARFYGWWCTGVSVGFNVDARDVTDLRKALLVKPRGKNKLVLTELGKSIDLDSPTTGAEAPN